MAEEPVFYIADLTRQEITVLTQLLSIAPFYTINPHWLSDQALLLTTFPAALLQPKSLLLRLACSLPLTPGRARLCPTHKPLNPILIRRIFLEISAECTSHLDRLTFAPHLPPNILAFVNRLHSVHILWMPADLYRAVFRPAPEESYFNRIESGCEACILSCIGQSHSTLSDLRASMLGRRKRRQAYPVLLKMVEEWIDWTGQGEGIREESDALATEIRKCRREMQRIRREIGMRGADCSGVENFRHEQENEKGYGTGSESQVLVDAHEAEEEKAKEQELDDEQRAEIERSLIEDYAKQLSTLIPTSIGVTAQGGPDAFREPMIFDAGTGTFHRRALDGGGLKDTKVGMESVDSRIDRGLSLSEEYARSYQNLLGISEDDEEPRGRTERRETRPDSRMTSWTDFE